MQLATVNHGYKYETEKICRIYFPAEKIEFCSHEEELREKDDEKKVVTRIDILPDGRHLLKCSAAIDGQEGEASRYFTPPQMNAASAEEKELAKAVTAVLTKITGIVPPWGILTGVRPSKLMRTYLSEMSAEEACEKFRNYLEVSDEKTRLAYNVAVAENAAVALSDEKSFSLYISIPFCPSRCSYCSFVSHSIAQAKKLIPDYVRLLCEEIRNTARISAQLGLRLETVYMGGGTPTSLSAQELDRILTAVNTSFDMSSVREFTVEAGRPDTIDADKLAALKKNSVRRISINPQTFSDSVLKAIGRRHSAEDIYEKFALARDMGFDNINTDLIAGLETDTPEGFYDSLDRAVALSPENITVHTLALKRSSDLVTEKNSENICRDTEKMVNYSVKKLYEAGYYPYYMYRQSKSVGNLENVGWCKKDRECLYNIYMMEEVHSVLSVGGGGVTKLKNPYSGEIERIYNFKYPYEYIGRFDELIERKARILSFYEEMRR